MSRCAICLRHKSVRFKTSRVAICTRCVNLLNKTDLTPRAATERLRQELRANVVHKHGDNGGVDDWVSRKFPNILDEWCKDPEKLGVPIKVIRAYRRQILCLDRRFLDYPKDWRMRAYRHKHRDAYTCNVCGKRDESCRDLQAHHIIFRSRGGTNYAANIVILCFEHHQAQHPDHVISAMGGEGAGFDEDESIEPMEVDDWAPPDLHAPPSLWVPETPTMPPRTQKREVAILQTVERRMESSKSSGPTGVATARLPEHAPSTISVATSDAEDVRPSVEQGQPSTQPSDTFWTADRLWTVIGVIFLLTILSSWR